MTNKLNSVTDIFRSVFFLVRQRDDGSYGVLLMTASPDLQRNDLPFAVVSPGISKFRWKRDEFKSVVLLLRKLGYFVFLYESSALQEWSHPLTELPVQDSTPVDDLRAIAQQLPECQTYVELYGGQTPLFLVRDPSPVEVVNDYARYVIAFFRTIREPLALSWLFLLSRVITPYNNFRATELREMFQEFADKDAILSTYAWFCYMRRTYSVDKGPTEVKNPPGSVIGDVLAALHSVDPALTTLHNRLYRTQIEHNSVEKVVQINDSSDTLFWVHPPYAGDGALDLEGTQHLITYLNDVEGHVALYDDSEDSNPHVGHLRKNEEPLSKWKPMVVGKSKVYTKPST